MTQPGAVGWRAGLAMTMAAVLGVPGVIHGGSCCVGDQRYSGPLLYPCSPKGPQQARNQPAVDLSRTAGMRYRLEGRGRMCPPAVPKRRHSRNSM